MSSTSVACNQPFARFRAIYMLSLQSSVFVRIPFRLLLYYHSVVNKDEREQTMQKLRHKMFLAKKKTVT